MCLAGDGWLLGKAFSSVDILLGVILNRLALLGYQVCSIFPFQWKGNSPHVHCRTLVHRAIALKLSCVSFARYQTGIAYEKPGGKTFPGAILPLFVWRNWAWNWSSKGFLEKCGVTLPDSFLRFEVCERNIRIPEIASVIRRKKWK